MKGSAAFVLSFSVALAILASGTSPGAALQPEVRQAIEKS